jgi:hypothetical protein
MSRTGLFFSVAEWRKIRARFYTKKEKKTLVCCLLPSPDKLLVVVKRVFISVSCRFPRSNVCRQLASAHQNPLQFRHCFVVVDRPSQLITGFVVVGYERACLLACRVFCVLIFVVVVVLEEIYWLCPSG